MLDRWKSDPLVLWAGLCGTGQLTWRGSKASQQQGGIGICVASDLGGGAETNFFYFVTSQLPVKCILVKFSEKWSKNLQVLTELKVKYMSLWLVADLHKDSTKVKILICLCTAQSFDCRCQAATTSRDDADQWKAFIPLQGFLLSFQLKLRSSNSAFGNKNGPPAVRLQPNTITGNRIGVGEPQ